MVNEILLKGDDFETNNHFLRISSNVLFLEFDEEEDRTGLTLMKKSSPVSFASSPSHSLPSSATPADIFFPHSRWFYYNFIKP
jgi:hypothetical protein